MYENDKVRGQWVRTLQSGREAFQLRDEVTGKLCITFATQGVASPSSFMEKVLYRQGVIDAAEIMWNGAAGDMQLEADVSDEIDHAFTAMLKKTGPMVLAPAQNMTTGYKFKRWVPCSTYEVN